jgi:hypothetical protein
MATKGSTSPRRNLSFRRFYRKVERKEGGLKLFDAVLVPHSPAAPQSDWSEFHSCRASWKPSRIAVFRPQVLHSNQKREEPPPTWTLAAGGALQKEHTLIGSPGRRNSGHLLVDNARASRAEHRLNDIVDDVEEL